MKSTSFANNDGAQAPKHPFLSVSCISVYCPWPPLTILTLQAQRQQYESKISRLEAEVKVANEDRWTLRRQVSFPTKCSRIPNGDRSVCVHQKKDAEDACLILAIEVNGAMELMSEELEKLKEILSAGAERKQSLQSSFIVDQPQRLSASPLGGGVEVSREEEAFTDEEDEDEKTDASAFKFLQEDCAELAGEVGAVLSTCAMSGSDIACGATR